MIKEMIKGIAREVFNNEKPVVIGTGGFSQLFAEENVFDDLQPNLVLNGLRIALELNR